MQSNDKKKICIVASSLGKGGAERSSAILSIMLDNLGFNVHVVTVLPYVEYKYSGELFNLGELKDKHSRIVRLIKFKNYLKTHNFDFIIDNRSRIQAYREFIITKLIYRSPTIYVIHNFKTSKAFTKYKWLNKFLYKNEILTTVSEEACLKFKKKFNFKNIRTIFNAFDFESISTQSKAIDKEEIGYDKYILFYGRIDNHHKNLKLLLKSYKLSKLTENNYKLLLVGDGKDLKMIKEFAKQLRLDKYIVFKTFECNPFPFVKHARFTVLTSKFEGFPMVIPESLSIGTPMVSVDCKSGPKEIIKDKFNSLLVKNNDKQALANAMNSFIFDDELYLKCKQNAKNSVSQFTMESIAKQWSKILNS